MSARWRQAGQGRDGRAAVPQGPGRRPPRAVRGGVRQGLATPRQAGQRASPGLRPLLQLPQERLAARRRRQPPDPAAAGRGPRRGPPGQHPLSRAPRPRGSPGPQRDRPLPGGRGLVAVAFEHRMSRAGDPNLHTHVLVQNAAQGPDGRWTALDSDRLYAQLMAADHLYLAAERAALTQRLGVRWGPVDERSGAAEIQGLDDRTLIERFSKRSEQIDQWLSEQGLSGIKASSAAAVATRQPKDYSESEESVYARWGAELAEQGVDERQLAGVCSGGRGRPTTRTELDAALDELAGPDGLTGQVSTFTRTDVVDALAKRLPVAASAQEALSQVEAAADRFLQERAVRVGRDRRLAADRYSTPELLPLERPLVNGATSRTGEGCAVVRSELVRQVLDRHASAGEDQAAMVRDLTQGGAGVAVVVGRAGSGKTWALGLAREASEPSGCGWAPRS